MSLLTPTKQYCNLFSVTAEALKEMGVAAVLLDVDNTLQEHHAGVPAEGVLEWIETVQAAGIPCCIASNSKDVRVSAFAQMVGLPYCALCAKPLPFGLRTAAKQLGVRTKDCLLIGDQIFTDVLAAKAAGMQVILLDPIKEESGWSFRLRRRLEHRLKQKWQG